MFVAIKTLPDGEASATFARRMLDVLKLNMHMTVLTL